MEFVDFFTKLGFSDKESDIFLALYKLGSQPASRVALHVGMERTGVYKLLCGLVKKNIVSETVQGGVKHFFVASPNVLKNYLTQQQTQFEELDNEFDNISQELQSYETQRYPHMPKISLYDGTKGIQALYDDIYDTIVSNKYLVIKFFASNTFESQITVGTTLKEYYRDLFYKLKKKKVIVESYLGNGIMIMEHVSKTTSLENLDQLPAGNASINIFIVGSVVYIVIYKDIPVGVKFASEDFANAMHFLLEKVEVE